MASTGNQVNERFSSEHAIKEWIVIIGSGAGGARAFVECARNAVSGGYGDAVAFITVDPKPEEEDARGIAWSSEQSSLLKANMHINTIGYDPHDVEKLARAFAHTADASVADGQLFRQRKEVGDVLSADFRKNVHNATLAGIEFFRVRDQAVSIVRHGVGYDIALTSGLRIFADRIVLALGHFPPTNYPNLKNYTNYYQNPWNWQSLSEIDQDSSVALLGTGPTAVDAYLVLREQGHEGVIHAFSRNGTMQYPRCRYDYYEPSICTRETLSEIAQATESLTFDAVLSLIVAEYHCARVDWRGAAGAFRNSLMDPHDALPRGIAEAPKVHPWFSVLKSMDDVTPWIWNLLSSEERGKYFQGMRHAHANVSYGMAATQAIKILQDLNDGKLCIFGGVGKVEHNGSSFSVRYRPKGTNKTRSKRFDVLIDCSGVGTQLTDVDDPLIQSMLDCGWLEAHPFGGAYCEFESGQVTDALGTPKGEIYTLVGSVSYGTRLLTHCLGELGKSAHRTAQAIDSKIRHRLHIGNT